MIHNLTANNEVILFLFGDRRLCPNKPYNKEKESFSWEKYYSLLIPDKI